MVTGDADSLSPWLLMREQREAARPQDRVSPGAFCGCSAPRWTDLSMAESRQEGCARGKEEKHTETSRRWDGGPKEAGVGIGIQQREARP